MGRLDRLEIDDGSGGNVAVGSLQPVVGGEGVYLPVVGGEGVYLRVRHGTRCCASSESHARRALKTEMGTRNKVMCGKKRGAGLRHRRHNDETRATL